MEQITENYSTVLNTEAQFILRMQREVFDGPPPTPRY